jgi:hypothetical protein
MGGRGAGPEGRVLLGGIQGPEGPCSLRWNEFLGDLRACFPMQVECRGIPPFRRKKGERMGHGGFLLTLLPGPRIGTWATRTLVSVVGLVVLFGAGRLALGGLARGVRGPIFERR